MKILLLGGTTEGRRILGSGLPLIYSVTTDYGAEAAAGVGNADVLLGRMDASAMEAFIKEHDVAGVIDATHPYATEVTKNARLACKRTGSPYVRVVREPVGINEDEVCVVSSFEEAVECLNGPRYGEANVLLTVGSKELSRFTKVLGYKERLFARVLPASGVIEACERLGLDAGHIVAMQGPFSAAMNKAMLEMTRARVLVTKDSGVSGGLEQKLEAARACDVGVILIRRPEETGLTAEEAVEWGRGCLQARRHRPRRFPLFPFFTDIADRKVVVVGGGEVAARRVRTLLACGALVTVVSPVFHKAFDEDSLKKNIGRIERAYRAGDMENAFMVVLATNDRELNRRLGTEARRAGQHVSVADAREECSFFFPALVMEGDIAVAVSTAGSSPGLCKRLTDRLRKVWHTWISEERESER